MIGYLSGRLRRAFRPVTPMDRHAEHSASISLDLRQVVDEHVAAGIAERENYARQLQATMDDVLKRLDRKNDGTR